MGSRKYDAHLRTKEHYLGQAQQQALQSTLAEWQQPSTTAVF
ncbi:MAG: hypothetical protein ACOVQA_11650 [Thermoflexibacteraceae bacterium]